MVQIITDIGYLESATVHLDMLMSSVTGGGESSGRKQAMFHVAREDAERQISSKLREKMDEFLELENYDWTLGEPQGESFPIPPPDESSTVFLFYRPCFQFYNRHDSLPANGFRIADSLSTGSSSNSRSNGMHSHCNANPERHAL